MISIGIGVNRSARVASQAQRDLSAYALRLRLLGAPLSDTKYQELLAFATALYTAYGRTDFVDLKRNVGTGPVAYSYHGTALTLTNGAVWASEGIEITTGGFLLLSNVSMLPAKTFFAIAVPITQTSLGISMLHTEGPTTGADSEITQSYRVSSTELNPYIYTSGGSYLTVDAGLTAPAGQILTSGFNHSTSNTITFNKNGVNHPTRTLPGNFGLNPLTIVTRFFRPLGGAKVVGAFVICDKDKVMDAAILHPLVKTHLYPALP